MYRLKAYLTRAPNKYSADSEHIIEVVGDWTSIFALWVILAKEDGWQHVETYNVDGTPCNPELGLENGRS